MIQIGECILKLEKLILPTNKASFTCQAIHMLCILNVGQILKVGQLNEGVHGAF